MAPLRVLLRLALVGFSLLALTCTARTAAARDGAEAGGADRLDPVPAAGALARRPGRGRVAVSVHLDARSGQVRGQVHAVFRNPTRAPLGRAYVWLLPNRLASPPAAQNDVNFYWIYPRRFVPGSMELTRVRAGAAERTLAHASWQPEIHAVAGRGVLVSIELGEPVAAGAEVRLIMDFIARIPERYGPIGCVDGQCTLMGGFYPMLAALDEAGWSLDSAPMRARMDVSVALAQPASVVLFGQTFGLAGDSPGRHESSGTSGRPAGPGRVSGQAQASGRVSGHAGVTAARAVFHDAPYAPLFVAPRLYQSSRRTGALTLRYLSAEPPPPTDEAHQQILPYTKENIARMGLASAAEAVELLTAAFGVMGAELPAQTLTMVEAPLRFELAQEHPGVVAVSDRIFRIFPARRLRKFHARQLVRALFAQVVGRIIAERGAEAAAGISVAADVVASYLTDLFVLRQYKRSESISDILSPVAFIPVVDQLLYAPQTMFAGAYFGGVIDDEPLRDHPERFMHERPRGRLYYEKLRDLLSALALQSTMRAIIADGATLRQAARSGYGSSMEWFFRQWSMPYPRLNYRLAGVSSTRLAGGGYEHVVTVRREVAAGERAPIEPVVVAVTLAGGEREELRWDGRGEVATLRFAASSAVDQVVIDPARRLVEHGLPGSSEHPLLDNRARPRLRFVYNSFGVLLNLSDLSALLAADFSLSRVHDVKNRVRMSLFTTASATVGASTTYTRSFGPPITPDRLLSSASVRLTGQRLRGGFFGGDDDRAATRLTLSAGLSQSDRFFVFEPRVARDLVVGGSISLTRRDAAGVVEADYLVSGTVGANYARLITPRGGHTLGVELDAALAFGDIAARSQLASAGGASGLRGFAPGALFARTQLITRLEYRHVFVHDLTWNLGHYEVVRGIGGAFFADLGVLSPCESYDVLSRGRVHVSGGYGLRVFYDSLGTLPQLMRVDVAVGWPAPGPGSDCLGAPLGESPPVMVYLGFLPPF